MKWHNKRIIRFFTLSLLLFYAISLSSPFVGVALADWEPPAPYEAPDDTYIPPDPYQAPDDTYISPDPYKAPEHKQSDPYQAEDPGKREGEERSGGANSGGGSSNGKDEWPKDCDEEYDDRICTALTYAGSIFDGIKGLPSMLSAANGYQLKPTNLPPWMGQTREQVFEVVRKNRLKLGSIGEGVPRYSCKALEKRRKEMP